MKTTVVTRAYADASSAHGVRGRLYRLGFPAYQLSVVSDEDDGKAGIVERLKRAWVPEEAAADYASHIADGASVVVVRATYKPLNAVRLANETFDTSGALTAGPEVKQFRVKTPEDHAPSVLKDHPRFLTAAPTGEGGHTITDQWFDLLSPPKERASAMPGGKLMLGGKVKTGRVASSAMSGGGFMSQKFWPAPLISNKRRKLSVLPDGGHPFSRLFSWPSTSR